ncbi:MAG: transketolase [bacterium]|nr:transketolase [bacterium]
MNLKQESQNQNLDTLSINTLRFLSIDAIEKAKSGHPGLPLGAAPMAYVLWTRFLKHHPHNPSWFDRDRFVLSAGHGSALLYSLLHLTGYDLPSEQIERFRQWGSLTPGHPERGLTPGVETTTGPLGQGFGNGVGMAIAEAHLAARFNRPDHQIISHFTYGIVSDGDLAEGIASEAASLAGHLKLGKLIYLYDDNRVTLAASTGLTFTENVAQRFDAYGWHTQTVSDGNDLAEIHRALESAKLETDRPSIILVRTHIGYGSPHKQDSFEAHGSPLGAEETKLTKQKLDWPLEPPFYIPEPVLTHYRRAIEKGKQLEADWLVKFKAYSQSYPELATELQQLMAGQLPSDWQDAIPRFPSDAKGMATRAASGIILNSLAQKVPGLMGGSADLNPSTYTALKDLGDFESPLRDGWEQQGKAGGTWDYFGRNIHFGIREHAMGAILNGMAAHGALIPFGATFLTFSDYMRPSIRLAALMGLHVIYIFTHDSIALGEDGPTHQSVEHLAALRLIPNLIVIRPADANETAEAWKIALQSNHHPVALILSRQNLPVLSRELYSPAEELAKGAYILADAGHGNPDLILIATGSEVSLIVTAGQVLAEQGVAVRLVSMPSWELFEAQPKNYHESVFPPVVRKRLAVEAGVTTGWERYVGNLGAVIGVDRFGASAPGDVVMKEYGFTVDNVVKRALALLAR